MAGPQKDHTAKSSMQETTAFVNDQGQRGRDALLDKTRYPAYTLPSTQAFTIKVLA
jgi:hypothetical protein